MFAVGARVFVKHEVDKYPTGLVPVGERGIVVYNDGLTIRVKMDRPIKGYEEWNNEVYFDVDGNVWQEDYIAENYLEEEPK